MLSKLIEIEKQLPSLLQTPDIWKSVYVDYHKPYVKRLWTQIDNTRIYLHQIFTCQPEESLLHPHPWPSAMKVIEGTYEMGVGYSETSEKPPIATKLILPTDSYYEMTHIHGWHYVRPLDNHSFSLMITGTPWKREVPKSSYSLRELDEQEKTILFNKFKQYYS